MHEMMLAKERQSAEDTRLVDRQQLLLQLSQCQRTCRQRQRPHHDNAVRRRAYTVISKQFYTFFLFHARKITKKLELNDYFSEKKCALTFAEGTFTQKKRKKNVFLFRFLRAYLYLCG